MPANALIETASVNEPRRAHAIDLVLIGQLLESRLIRDGVQRMSRDGVDSVTAAHSVDSHFSRVWRDHVVPVAAADRSEWEIGMCAEITGL
eukprot:4839312-Prymnesium_polylepis.1